MPEGEPEPCTEEDEEDVDQLKAQGWEEVPGREAASEDVLSREKTKVNFA